MKANELRVSNMIKLTDTGEIMTVTGIMQDSHGVKVFGITPDGTYCNAWIEHCEQITLTPEWLERFGFVKVKRDYVMGIHNEIFSGLIKLRLDLKLNVWILSIGSYADLTRFNKVHVFQNVIHSLTGTELTLTEPKTTKQNG